MSDQQQQPQHPQSPNSPREEAYRVLMLARRDPDLFQNEFGLLKQINFRGRFDLNLAIYLVSGTIKLQKRLDHNSACRLFPTVAGVQHSALCGCE
jgi:hypothetical protein